jgi:hypothetical protein
MRIELHIDRLVLDGTGIEPGHAAMLEEALESELSRLLTGAPAVSWQQSRHLRRLAASPIRLGPPGDVRGLAQGVARSVHGALTSAAAKGGGPG